MSTCVDDIQGLRSLQRNRLKNRTLCQNEGNDSRSEGERECVQRFNAGMIVDIVDLRAARMLMGVGLGERMRMDQDAMIMILMNVLERRQAKSQHQRDARL